MVLERLPDPLALYRVENRLAHPRLFVLFLYSLQHRGRDVLVSFLQSKWSRRLHAFSALLLWIEPLLLSPGFVHQPDRHDVDIWGSPL